MWAQAGDLVCLRWPCSTPVSGKAGLRPDLPIPPRVSSLVLQSRNCPFLCMVPSRDWFSAQSRCFRGRNASCLHLHLSVKERRSQFFCGCHWWISTPQGNNQVTVRKQTHLSSVYSCVLSFLRWKRLWKLSVMGFCCPFVINKNSKLPSSFACKFPFLES